MGDVGVGASPRRNGLLAGVAALVAAAIYGPMLLPGFPLRYDLVSVPRPVLGEDALGLGDRLPRAIPLDAAVAVLAKVAPDDLLTQVLGLLALTLAGWGVAVLTPTSMPGRLIALLIAEWNPFVLEQLAIGHLPHLLGYGAVPWVAVFGCALVRSDSGSTARRDRLRAWGGMTAAAGFGSLTPGGGALVMIAGLAGLLAGLLVHGGPQANVVHPLDDRRSGRSRRALIGVLSLVVLQLPWLVAAAAAPAFAVPVDSVDGGVTAFALRSETGWGRLVDAAGLAGMWNESALPASRGTVLARVSTVLLLALAVAGLPAVRRLWRSGHRAEVSSAAVAAGVGYLVAVLPVLPGGGALLRTLIDVLPGAGLLRDGHRWLGLPAVVLAVLCGLGMTELARLAALPLRDPGPRGTGSGARTGDAPGEPSDARPTGFGSPAGGDRTGGVEAGVAVFVALLVIASMPDLAGGLAGSLRARHYPAQWAQVRAVLDRSDDRARVLVLPWQPFRIFGWSGPDPVLDPAPRLLPRQSIVSDALTVSGQQLPEEGLGAKEISLDLADGELSAERLRSLSVGWVLIERGTPGRLPALPSGWTTVVDGPELSLLRAPEPLPAAPRAGAVRSVAVIGTQGAAGLVFLAGLTALVLGRFRRRPVRRSARRFARR